MKVFLGSHFEHLLDSMRTKFNFVTFSEALGIRAPESDKELKGTIEIASREPRMVCFKHRF